MNANFHFKNITFSLRTYSEFPQIGRMRVATHHADDIVIVFSFSVSIDLTFILKIKLFPAIDRKENQVFLELTHAL